VRLWSWVKELFSEFSRDSAVQNAAAIAFYTMLSLAPLLVIAIGVAGLAFGGEAAQNAIVEQFRGTLGENSAVMIQNVVQRSAMHGSGGVWATVVGVGMLVVGAMGVFAQVQSSLNTVWNVRSKPGRGVMSFIMTRVLSLAMVLCIGFLLLVSLAVSAAISATGALLGSSAAPWAASILNFGLSLAVITLLFAAMYKFLPDVRIGWRDVLLGAAVTSLLFNVGKFIIAAYLGRAGVVNVYGAAGSLVMVLLWVYYSAIIFLLGAEFTQVYARRRGSHVEPGLNAVWAEPAA